MQSITQRTYEKKQFYYAVFVPTIICVVMFLVFIVEQGLNIDFHKGGIYPRKLDSWWGVFTAVFIHADWGHLFNNLLSFFILSISLFYFYREIAFKILTLTYLLSGVLLWFIGRESWHIGASGWIYGLSAFLFLSGLIRRHVPLIALALIVTFIYGGMVWHIMPWEINDPISWEGHLAGGMIGFALALIYRRFGPQKPVKIWEDENEDENDEDLYFEETSS